MRKLCGDLTHVFCPAEPTKNCPRDQPQDNSALHSLARAAPPETPTLSGRAASGMWDCLLLWLIQTLSSQRVASLFILPPPLLHLLHGRLLSISWWQTTSLLVSGHSQAIPVGTQQGFPGRKQWPKLTKVAAPWWLMYTTSASCNWHHRLVHQEKTGEGLCPRALLKLCYLWNSLIHKESPNH